MNSFEEVENEDIPALESFSGNEFLEVVGEGTGIVGTEIICDRVKEMMEGKEGRKTRERGMELKRMTREAMKKGESSDRNLDELIECLARGKDRHVK